MLNSVRTWNGNPNGPLLKYALGLRCSYRVLQRIVPKVRDVFAEIPYTRFSYAINRHARYLVFFFFLINPIHKRAIHELETRGEPRRGINPFFSLFFFAVEKKSDLPRLFFQSKRRKKKGFYEQQVSPPPLSARFHNARASNTANPVPRLFKEENPLVSGLLI